MKPIQLFIAFIILLFVQIKGNSQIRKNIGKQKILSTVNQIRMNVVDEKPFLTTEQTARLNVSFKQVNFIKINLPQLLQKVEANKTDIPVYINHGIKVWDMLISQNELRSPDYKREITTDSGRIEIPRDACGTFAGYEKNDPESWVRMNIRQHSFSAMIHANNETYYLEMLKKFIPGADEQWIILYTADDVVPVNASCGGGERLIEKMEENKQQIQGKILEKFGNNNQAPSQKESYLSKLIEPTNNFSQYMYSTQAANCRKLEIATDSDYDNYSLCCGYEVNFSDVLDNLNNTEGLVFPQFGIKFHVRYQHQWTTSSDPYSGEALCNGDVSSNRLYEFRNYWNNNYFQAIPRDLAILYSGNDFDGGTIGCAKTGSIADANFAQNNLYTYMVVQAQYWLIGVPYTWTSAAFANLTGHEMGHILGSGHDNSASNIMESTASLVPNNNWLSSSINSINAKLATNEAKDRLTRRYIFNAWPISYSGIFNGGEVHLRAGVSNSSGNFSFEGVDLCTVIGSCTISTSNGAGITIKTAPCNNSGY